MIAFGRILTAGVLACGTLALAPDVPWDERATSPRIAQLQRDAAAGTPGAAARFWAELERRGTPLVEADAGNSGHALVTFAYRAPDRVKAVYLIAQLSATRDEFANPLIHLAGSDVWHKTFVLRSDLRFSYGFAVDPDHAAAALPQADPLNRSPRVAGNVGPSVVTLANATAQPWLSTRAGAARGNVVKERLHSRVLGTERTIWVYTPPGYDRLRADPYPVLTCFDGLLYAANDLVGAPAMLDAMIAAHRLPPMVAVFVGQSSRRNAELSNDPAFVDYLASDVMPHVRDAWHGSSDPARNIVCGSSAGGLGGAYAAFRRPDVFGNVLSQSGAFWPGQHREDAAHEWLTGQYAAAPRLPIRFVLQVGILEQGPTPGNGPSILRANRRLRDVLTAKGYHVGYTEYGGGHEPVGWRAQLPGGLLELAGDPHPVEALHGIVAAFASHPVVIVAEARHALRQAHELYTRLVRDPAFQAVVDDIVIEFASRNNQPLLDRYVAGDDVPLEELRHLSRDTTKAASWESPVYAKWLAAIREVNRSLPPAHRLHVLAGDTAIDWNRIHTRSEWDALGPNDVSVRRRHHRRSTREAPARVRRAGWKPRRQVRRPPRRAKRDDPDRSALSGVHVRRAAVSATGRSDGGLAPARRPVSADCCTISPEPRSAKRAIATA